MAGRGFRCSPGHTPSQCRKRQWRPIFLASSPSISFISARTTPVHSQGTPRMASTKKIRVAIVGLGFGAEFIPIYQNHPSAEMYAICRRNAKGLNETADRYGVKVRYTDYDKLLTDPNVD